ncbi:hypothetical protein QA995_14985 [Streptomyces scabiei]|uniref:hypothetical protein n=1 Tax=Streptomyces scabiei TaxID=1930 RepID=UPI002FF29F65
MSAATRVAHAAETIRARWEHNVESDPQTEAAQALEDTCQLLDPEVAAELERLRKRVADQSDQQDDLALALGRSIGTEWADLISIAAGLVKAEDEVRTLRAERHSTNESLSDAAEQLRVDRDRIAELESAAYGDAKVRLLTPVEQIRHLHACVAAQLHRADTLDRLCREQRARADAAEQSPLAWAERLDAKSLDNLLISLGSATEHEPMDEAIGQIHQILAGFREAAFGLPVPPLTVFRASHDSIVMGLYTTAAEARKHCEAEERRSWGAGHTLVFDWIEDDEDRVAELVVTAGQNEESTTGYVVEAREVASAYDPDADE